MDVKEAAVKYKLQMWSAAYLEQERKALTKHEYVEGRVLAMAGASPAHNLIVSNLIVSIGTFLKGKDCNIYPGDLRVYVKSRESYFYPDVTIICGEMEFSDEQKDTVKNPAVIFEVLSPPTEGYDLGRKFFFYMQIPSLRQYVTINSSDLRVRSGMRGEDDSWKFVELEDRKDRLRIGPIGFDLNLQEVYAGIEVPDPSSQASHPSLQG